MITAGFELQKWPKRHEYLVEECLARGWAIHVSDVLPMLTGYHRELIASWNPRGYPWFTLVPRMGGPFRRWWFLCPRCERRCEALYVPPGIQREDWRCRLCWGLIYASQRHGFRHPLSRVLTHRKKVTLRKEVLRQRRQWARRQSQVVVPTTPSGADEEKAWIAEGVAMARAEIARRETRVKAVGARIAGLAGLALGTLRELAVAADSKRVRADAKSALARYERRLPSQRQPVRPTEANVSRPTPTLSATEIERLMRAIAEDDAGTTVKVSMLKPAAAPPLPR